MPIGASHQRAFRAGAALLLVPALALAFVAGARADTTFGGDPSQPVLAGASCSLGAPLYPPALGTFPGTGGSQSCMWGWNNPAVGTDIAPIPPTGGSGTVTSVTLPAMPNPGSMQVVVLTAGLSAGSNPSKPDYVCCQVKQVGPTFTVPAGQVTTVPQSLHVSATEEANLSVPGDTSFGDQLAVSVLSPTASLPIRYTGHVGEQSITDFDGVYAYYPAPTGPNGEFRSPYGIYGFQMLASFTLAPQEAAPTRTPTGGGLRLIRGPLRVGPDGRTVRLGTATNPPIAKTTQTLTAPVARARPAGASAARRKRAVVYGVSRTRVRAGRTVPLKLKLKRRARAILKRHGKLSASLRVVSTTTAGKRHAVTRNVNIEPARRKRQG